MSQICFECFAKLDVVPITLCTVTSHTYSQSQSAFRVFSDYCYSYLIISGGLEEPDIVSKVMTSENSFIDFENGKTVDFSLTWPDCFNFYFVLPTSTLNWKNGLVT